MVELVIMRHAQSVADSEGRLEGRVDSPLTELGREQAQKAAEWLSKNFKFDLIISSPLMRATETAEIIGKHLNAEVGVDEALTEFNNGILAGMLKEEANQKHPIPDGGRKYYQRIPKGESIIEFRLRCEAFFGEVLDLLRHEEEDKRILIVAHSDNINMLFQCFLNLPVNNEMKLCTSETGIHVWKIEGRDRIIVKNNAMEHFVY